MERINVQKIYLSNAQRFSRPCETVHKTIAIKPHPGYLGEEPHTVLERVVEIFGLSSSFQAFTESNRKILLTLQEYAEIARLNEFVARHITFYVEETPYVLTEELSSHHLPSGNLTQEIFVAIDGLPMHLCTLPIVETILSPYCVIDYIPLQDDHREDPPAFSCNARTQLNTRIPKNIHVLTPHIPARSSPTEGNQEYPLLDRFIITLHITKVLSANIEEYEYMYPIISVEADEPTGICFVAPTFLDPNQLDSLRSSIILTFHNNDPFSSKEQLEWFLNSHRDTAIAASSLSENSYLLQSTFHNTLETLARKATFALRDHINNGTATVTPWFPSYGSTGSADITAIDIVITDLPCHLCTPQIVTYILSSFCMVHTRHTRSAPTETITKYRCSAWSITGGTVPKKIKIKKLPKRILPHHQFCTLNDDAFYPFYVCIKVRKTESS